MRCLALLWLLGLMVLPACTAANASAPAPPGANQASAYPPDFALTFYIEGEWGTTDPLRRSAQHVVEASRKLRVMLGPGSTATTYPPPTARLSPAQMAALYRLAAAAVDDPAPPPGATASVVYRVSLTASGRTTLRAFDADARPTPDAARLLALLVELRGGR